LCVAWGHQSSEERYLCAIVPCIRFSQHSQLFCYVLFAYKNVVGVKYALCSRFLIEWCDPLSCGGVLPATFFLTRRIKYPPEEKMLCNSQGNAIKSKQPTCGGWDHSNQHQPFFQISIYYLTRRAFYFFGANVGPGCIWSMLNECFNSLKFLNKDLHPLPYGNICLLQFFDKFMGFQYKFPLFLKGFSACLIGFLCSRTRTLIEYAALRASAPRRTWKIRCDQMCPRGTIRISQQ
jgi:hypothetical protein